jgi:hypothetical protein
MGGGGGVHPGPIFTILMTVCYITHATHGQVLGLRGGVVLLLSTTANIIYKRKMYFNVRNKVGLISLSDSLLYVEPGLILDCVDIGLTVDL